MISAFGVEHGEVSKGVADKATRGYLHGKSFVQGAKLGRLRMKQSLKESNLATTFTGGVKQGYKAGKDGTLPILRSRQRLASQTAKMRLNGDMRSIQSAARRKHGVEPTIRVPGNH